ncbi:MAG: hypothetical protein ACRDBQ_18780 [Shewanella sp.]
MHSRKEIVFNVGGLLNHLPDRAGRLLSYEQRRDVIIVALNEFLWKKFNVIPAGFSIAQPPQLCAAFEAIQKLYNLPAEDERCRKMYWELMDRITTIFSDHGHDPDKVDKVLVEMGLEAKPVSLYEGMTLPLPRVFDHGVSYLFNEARPRRIRFSWVVPKHGCGKNYSMYEHIRSLAADVKRLRRTDLRRHMPLHWAANEEISTLASVVSIYDEFIDDKRF